ncbi:MAG: hypothetical protein HKN36_09160 [Hellea sp.]|nr:hypothetical protein [Hellea sp.]
MSRMPKAYAGMVADQQTTVRLSRLAESPINPGRVVTLGSADDKAVEGGAGMFLGIAMADRTLSPEQNGVFAVGDTVGYVARPALIWCVAKVGVNAGDAAAYDLSTGELNLLGTPIPNSNYASSAASGELVKLRLQ